MSFNSETEGFESYKCQNAEKREEHHAVNQKAGGESAQGRLLFACVFAFVLVVCVFISSPCVVSVFSAPEHGH